MATDDAKALEAGEHCRCKENLEALMENFGAAVWPCPGISIAGDEGLDEEVAAALEDTCHTDECPCGRKSRGRALAARLRALPVAQVAEPVAWLRLAVSLADAVDEYDSKCGLREASEHMSADRLHRAKVAVYEAYERTHPAPVQPTPAGDALVARLLAALSRCHVGICASDRCEYAGEIEDARALLPRRDGEGR